MKKFQLFSLLSLLLGASANLHTNQLIDEIVHARESKVHKVQEGSEVEMSLDELIQNISDETLDKPVERVQRSKSREIIQKLALVALTSYLYLKTKIHTFLTLVYSYIPKP